MALLTVHCHTVTQHNTVVSILIPGGHSCTQQKIGGGGFDKVADQNVPLFSLGKLYP